MLMFKSTTGPSPERIAQLERQKRGEERGGKKEERGGKRREKVKKGE